jgi:hypothetical protein
MKSRKVINVAINALLAVASWTCAALTPPPFYPQLLLVDRVAAAAKANVPTRSTAFELLVRVAEGRMQAAAPDAEEQVGLERGNLRGSEFKDETVRSHALRKIGELDLPEALDYLQNLKKADIQPDQSGQMWSSAQIALRQAQLNRIPDESGRIRFLEDTTADRGAVGSWAADQLCNMGSRQSLSFVAQYVRRAYSLPRDVDHTLGFCEARIEVVGRDPDRAKALVSILHVVSGVTDSELLGWAISELRAMHSPRAEAEVQRYADEIEGLPDGSQLKNALWIIRVDIRGMAPPKRK